MKLVTGRRAEDGADERPRTTNATINYKLNGCNRFSGTGGGEDGHQAIVLALRPDLRFEIQRPSSPSRGLL